MRFILFILVSSFFTLSAFAAKKEKYQAPLEEFRKPATAEVEEIIERIFFINNKATEADWQIGLGAKSGYALICGGFSENVGMLWVFPALNLPTIQNMTAQNKWILDLSEIHEIAKIKFASQTECVAAADLFQSATPKNKIKLKIVYGRSFSVEKIP